MENPRTGNILKDVEPHLPEEQFSTLVSSPGVRIERIVSTGNTTPEGEWYDQASDEWVMVVQGAARLAFEDGRELEMEPGDHVLLPAHCRHRVEWTSDGEQTVWLAVHFDPDDEEKRK